MKAILGTYFNVGETRYLRVGNSGKRADDLVIVSKEGFNAIRDALKSNAQKSRMLNISVVKEVKKAVILKNDAPPVNEWSGTSPMTYGVRQYQKYIDWCANGGEKPNLKELASDIISKGKFDLNTINKDIAYMSKHVKREGKDCSVEPLKASEFLDVLVYIATLRLEKGYVMTNILDHFDRACFEKLKEENTKDKEAIKKSLEGTINSCKNMNINVTVAEKYLEELSNTEGIPCINENRYGTVTYKKLEVAEIEKLGKDYPKFGKRLSGDSLSSSTDELKGITGEIRAKESDDKKKVLKLFIDSLKGDLDDEVIDIDQFFEVLVDIARLENEDIDPSFDEDCFQLLKENYKEELKQAMELRQYDRIGQEETSELELVFGLVNNEDTKAPRLRAYLNELKEMMGSLWNKNPFWIDNATQLKETVTEQKPGIIPTETMKIIEAKDKAKETMDIIINKIEKRTFDWKSPHVIRSYTQVVIPQLKSSEAEKQWSKQLKAAVDEGKITAKQFLEEIVALISNGNTQSSKDDTVRNNILLEFDNGCFNKLKAEGDSKGSNLEKLKAARELLRTAKKESPNFDSAELVPQQIANQRFMDFIITLNGEIQKLEASKQNQSK